MAWRLRRQLEKEPEASSEDILSWYEQRKKLGDVLGLNFSQFSAFGVPFATLLPLVSGLASHFFKH